MIAEALMKTVAAENHGSAARLPESGSVQQVK
jgi:hypothetical protein